MTAKRQDIAIEQGADFDQEFDLPATLNLTGIEAAVQLRSDFGYPAPLLTLTLGNGLSLNATARRLRVVIAAAVTAALFAGKYVYDIKTRETSGRNTRTHQGVAVVSPQVTVFSSAPPPVTESYRLLLEDGFALLLEDGSNLLLEEAA